MKYLVLYIYFLNEKTINETIINLEQKLPCIYISLANSENNVFLLTDDEN